MSADRVFENPTNGHRETVSGVAWLWSLLFGWFYMLTVGLWGHVFIQIFVYVVVALIGGGPFLIIAVPAVWLIYAVSINSMLANRYLRQGWREMKGDELWGRANAAPAEPPPSPAPSGASTSVADELEKLAGLRDKGLLTPDEFDLQKAKLLAAGS